MSHPLPARTLLRDLNERFLRVHREKEDAFWAAKMGLPGVDPAAFPAQEKAWHAFAADADSLPLLRRAAADPGLDADTTLALQGWMRFFAAHAMENLEARALHQSMVDQETRLQAARSAMELGYRDPAAGAFTRASSVKLGLLVRTAPDEALRRAAYQGLKSIEGHVLEHGFLELVRGRNRLARLLGYEDYYDFKVSRQEGYSKRKLFSVLEDLERSTRAPAQKAVADLEARYGAAARQGHNFMYLAAGDVTHKLDPYFDFGSSLLRWGRSFAALGIRYRGAGLTLDLLDRRGKYENGFMHGPVPAWVENGRFHPAQIRFTANAIPGQIGSGQRATETLFHEGGHAAHFSNVAMPAPCFGQEYAPTSVAFAETQSMFLDRLVESPEWLVRYALDAAGQPLPAALMLESLRLKHPLRAFHLRALLTVPFAERALYELPDHSLTPENARRACADVERQLQFLETGVRPVLSVPHLLAWESSAYYHGYVLAEMAVNQTRRFFLRRDGAIADNPAVGRDLCAHYWQPGNSQTFFALIEGLTGAPFSAEATAAEVGQPLAEAEAEAQRAVERAGGSRGFSGAVDLDARIRIAHGAETIADTGSGASFEDLAARFAHWVDSPAASPR